jgi:hypothetical protein
MSDVYVSLDPSTGGATITTVEDCEVLAPFPNAPIIDLSLLGGYPSEECLQRQQYLNDLQQLEEEVRQDQ